MRAFVDTNVALDVLLKRTPFADDAAMIWAMAESDRIEGLISAVSFTTVYYIVRRTHSRRRAEAANKLLRDVFTVAACDGAVINQAVDSDFSDFEDAVQYFSALAAGADVLVTRNESHFASAKIPVMTPAAFLAHHPGSWAPTKVPPLTVTRPAPAQAALRGGRRRCATGR